MFEKSLSDMVKGIRAAGPAKEGVYLAKMVGDVSAEMKSTDPGVKAQAVLKACYLFMLGFEMADAPFHVIEVMSQPLYAHKRVGYLAASSMFTPDTDVILLTTHLFRKVFTAGGVITSGAEGLQYEIGSALQCMANVATKDLAQDLLADVYGMLNSSRPYVRKKAVLLLLRIYHVWPKALRLSFDRLREKLNDDDPGVAAAAVYVICELAQANPRNYLPLAPLLFKLMTTSTANWLLIKLCKTLGFLVPLEPRLAKKLANPLCEIIETTPAKSLQYECLHTLLAGEITSKNTIRVCLSSIESFITHSDRNLVYIGLTALRKLMAQHPRAVDDHKDLVLQCLGDEDATIRLCALDIITAMASRRTLRAIARKLIEHLDVSDGHYRDTVLRRLLDICAHDSYAHVTDFEWYVSTLVDLTHLQGVSAENAAVVTEQLIDVVVRVDGVQQFAVGVMERVLHDRRLYNSHNAMSRALYAAGFIVGEFAEHVSLHAGVIEAMLGPDVQSLAPDVQIVFVQALLKVYASALRSGTDAAWRSYMARLAALLEERLPAFCRSNDVEVQERAVSSQQTLGFVAAQIAGSELPADDLRVLVNAFCSMFDDKLNPVGPKAQKRVPVPKGLDLDKWINEPPAESSDDDDDDGYGDDGGDDLFGDEDGAGGGIFGAGSGRRGSTARREPTEAEAASAERQRKRDQERRANDPYYIKDSGRGKQRGGGGDDEVDVDAIPVRDVEFDLPKVEVRRGDKKRRKKRRGFLDDVDDDDDAAAAQSYTVKKVSDMPKGAHAASSDEDAGNNDDSDNDLGKVDLSRPLGADEAIPRARTYAERSQEKEAAAAAAKKKAKKDKKKAKKDKKKSKKDKKEEPAAAAATPIAVDMFDPLAAAPAAEAAKESKKKSKKDKKKDKKREKEASPSKKKKKKKGEAAAAAGDDDDALAGVHPARVRTLVRSGDLTVQWAVVTSAERPRDAQLLLRVEAAAGGAGLEGVEVAASDSNFMRAKGSFKAGAVPAGEARSGAIRLQIVKSTEAYATELTVTRAGAGAERRTVAVPVSSLVHPGRIDMPELRELLMRQDDGPGSCRKLASRAGLVLYRHSVGEALKLIPRLLNVRLVEAVSFTATYYGRTVHGAHVAVLVKANKADVGSAQPVISVDIKTSQQFLSDGLLEELSVLGEQ